MHFRQVVSIFKLFGGCSNSETQSKSSIRVNVGITGTTVKSRWSYTKGELIEPQHPPSTSRRYIVGGKGINAILFCKGMWGWMKMVMHHERCWRAWLTWLWNTCSRTSKWGWWTLSPVAVVLQNCWQLLRLLRCNKHRLTKLVCVCTRTAYLICMTTWLTVQAGGKARKARFGLSEFGISS